MSRCVHSLKCRRITQSKKAASVQGGGGAARASRMRINSWPFGAVLSDSIQPPYFPDGAIVRGREALRLSLETCFAASAEPPSFRIRVFLDAANHADEPIIGEGLRRFAHRHCKTGESPARLSLPYPGANQSPPV